MMNFSKSAIGMGFAAVAALAVHSTDALAIDGSDYGWGGFVVTPAKNISPTPDQRAIMKEKGVGKDWLKDYFAYLEHATRQDGGGSCCGVGDFDNRIEVVETGNPEIPYKVNIKYTRSGLLIEGGGIWIDIPAKLVLDAEKSLEICDAYNDAAEAQSKASGKKVGLECNIPPVALFAHRDGSEFYPGMNKHIFGGQSFPVGGSVSKEFYLKHRTKNYYCFHPAPENW